MDLKIIDSLVREIARGDELPARPTWDQLKNSIISQTNLIAPGKLEDWKPHIAKNFYQCRKDQMEQDELQMASTDSNPSPPNSSKSVRARKAAESSEEDSFMPLIDAKKTVSVLSRTKPRDGLV